jgi:hypothetical protein
MIGAGASVGAKGDGDLRCAPHITRLDMPSSQSCVAWRRPRGDRAERLLPHVPGVEGARDSRCLDHALRRGERGSQTPGALALAFEELAPAGSDRTRRQLEAELTKVADECARLAEAIGRGGRLTSLLDRLTRLEGRAEALRAELAAAPPPAPTFDRKALEQRLHVKLAGWRGPFTRNVATGNAMLRTLLAEPIRFTPVIEDRRRGYRFDGRIALDRILTGLATLPEVSAKLHRLVSSPEGTEPVCIGNIERRGFVRAA